MADYLRVLDGVAVEAWTAPAGKTPSDCFPADLAATFHAADEAAVGWTWDGASFAAPVVPPPTAAELAAYAKARRDATEAAGITVSGVAVASGPDDQTRVANAYAGMQVAGASAIRFKAAAGFIVLTLDQVKAVGAALFAHTQACFDAEDRADAGIHASPPTVTTASEVDAIFAAVPSAF